MYSLDKIGMGVGALAIVSALTLASGEIALERDSLADVLVEKAWAVEPDEAAVMPPIVALAEWSEDLTLRRPVLTRPADDVDEVDEVRKTRWASDSRPRELAIAVPELPPRLRSAEAVLRRPALRAPQLGEAEGE